MYRKRRMFVKLMAYLIMLLMFGLTIASIATVNAASKDTWIKKEYQDYCTEIGNAYYICPELLMAMVENESGGDPKSVSSAGAVGLTQIIPKYSKYSREELFDPYTSIKACAEIMFDYCERFEDVELALIAYNCGEFSSTFKNCEKNGTTTKYAEKIISRADELHKIHGK